MALPIRYQGFPDPDQNITVRLLAQAADDAFLISGRDGGQVGYGGTGTGEDLELHSNPSEDGSITLGPVTIDEATGKVGIGSAAPAELLEVFSNSSANVAIKIRSTVTNSQVRVFFANDAREWRMGVNNLDEFAFRDHTGGKDVVVLEPGAPSDALVVRAGGEKFLVTGSTPSTPSGGVAVQAEDVDSSAELFAYNEAAERHRLTGNISARTSQLTKTTDTTLVDIGITRNVEAGKTYRFRAEIHSTCDSTGGEKYDMNAGTATATSVIWQAWAISNSSATIEVPIRIRNTSLGATCAQQGTTSGFVVLTGIITVNAGGSLGPRFAQFAASGSSTVEAATFEIEEV